MDNPEKRDNMMVKLGKGFLQLILWLIPAAFAFLGVVSASVAAVWLLVVEVDASITNVVMGMGSFVFAIMITFVSSKMVFPGWWKKSGMRRWIVISLPCLPLVIATPLLTFWWGISISAVVIMCMAFVEIFASFWLGPLDHSWNQ